MLWEAVRCLLCSASAISFSQWQPCHATCWEPGCRGPGTGVPGTGNWGSGCWDPLKGFGSWFHEPGSNSDTAKLTNKLALVKSVVVLGDLLMLQQYFSVTLRLPQPARGSPARSLPAWLDSRPDLYCRHPELQLGTGCAVLAATALPQLWPSWQSFLRCVWSRPGLLAELAAVLVQIKQLRCSWRPSPT